MSNYPLRLDPKLMEKIKKLAIYEGRSMNKEIEHILKKEINKLEKSKPTLFK
ncbi:Arc family DNA-binding protein [Limosilactobacillus reuteri]|uniref:Arc family DNA-binding protein n=1 Tax=Limosilactobacillus reuteri TaxID=1598 RepID=UPI00399622CD